MQSLNTRHHQPVAALVYSSIGPVLIGCMMLILGVFVSTSKIFSVIPPVGGTLLAFGLPLVALITAMYPILYYFLFTYQITEQTITVNSGVLFRQYETINFSRVQVIDNERNPILMLFGITRVEVWTASPDQLITTAGMSAQPRPDATLLLSKNDAEELKSFVLHRPIASPL